MATSSLKIASASHQGKKRSRQQDLVAHRDNFGVVCDGMGGAGAEDSGEIAAEKSMNTVTGRFDNDRPTTLAEARVWIPATLQAANAAVVSAAKSDPNLKGMGSTVLIGLFIEDAALLGWLGDSRGYRLRGKVLQQVTQDHSLAQAYVNSGQLTPEEAEVSRFRHVLYRFAGNGQAPNERGEMVQVDVRPGDRFLLSSDGIDKELKPDVIAQLLASSDDPAVVCQALIDAANANQGRDNISTVVMFAEGHLGTLSTIAGAPASAKSVQGPDSKAKDAWYTPFLRAVMKVFGC